VLARVIPGTDVSKHPDSTRESAGELAQERDGGSAVAEAEAILLRRSSARLDDEHRRAISLVVKGTLPEAALQPEIDRIAAERSHLQARLAAVDAPGALELPDSAVGAALRLIKADPDWIPGIRHIAPGGTRHEGLMVDVSVSGVAIVYQVHVKVRQSRSSTSAASSYRSSRAPRRRDPPSGRPAPRRADGGRTMSLVEGGKRGGRTA
jgi:hypothetical protein